jgi:hypothetical protein
VLATPSIHDSCSPPVVVMQASEHRYGNDNRCRLVRRLHSFVGRDTLSQALVRPRLVEVLMGVLLEHPTKVRLVQDDDVVQALAPDAAQIPLADGVHIRTPGWDADDFDAGSLSHRSEVPAELAVVVADQEPRPFAEGRRLAKLLRRPSVARRSGHADVHDLPGPVLHDEEREDGLEQHVVQLEEVAGPDIVRMVLKERLLGLSALFGRQRPLHVLLDRALADPDSQLEQLAADAFSAPKRVVSRHCHD